jgi:glyceraldehyde-3-phosphate dehydrogenase/erythrose-4-phosphate dehydrogenase
MTRVAINGFGRIWRLHSHREEQVMKRTKLGFNGKGR